MSSVESFTRFAAGFFFVFFAIAGFFFTGALFGGAAFFGAPSVVTSAGGGAAARGGVRLLAFAGTALGAAVDGSDFFPIIDRVPRTAEGFGPKRES